MKIKFVLLIVFFYSGQNISCLSAEVLTLEYYPDSRGVRQARVRNAPRLGLVVSGGSARGIVHIGVIKALEQSGLKFDMILGTSMGSIVGD